MQVFFCCWRYQEIEYRDKWGPYQYINEILVGQHPVDELAEYGNCEFSRWVLVSWREIEADEQQLEVFAETLMVTRRDLEF